MTDANGLFTFSIFVMSLVAIQIAFIWPIYDEHYDTQIIKSNQITM